MAADQLPQRIPEPELMDEPEQAAAYAQADFEEPHGWFVQQLQATFPEPCTDTALDLGCGPADITLRLARAWPRCIIHGVDGAEAMLVHGRRAIATHGLEARVQLYRQRLPASRLPRSRYGFVFSNSLLHHLHRPEVLWQTVRRFTAPRGAVFIMDLMRPRSRAEAAQLVQAYAGEEPEILQRDFYNSLLAAFRPQEIQQQLHAAELTTLTVEPASDRHLIIHGVLA